MLYKIFFCEKWGGARMFLLLLAFISPILTTHGQGYQCVQPICSNLKVEVVRHENVSSTSCTSGTSSCNDKFRQIAYTVYLRHSKQVSAADPLLPFNLEYDMLDIAVSLKNNSTPQFSYIDAVATQACFTSGVGAKWIYNLGLGDNTIFKATEKSVAISFANFASGSPDCGTILPNGTGNVITFKYYTPANPPLPADPELVDICGSGGPNNPPIIRCAYAELFTVVVNAYPGELNGLQFDVTNYVPNFASPSVCTIDKVITGPNNGINNVTVLPPTHYGVTANSNILATLLPPVPGGTDEKVFQIQIENTGTLPITVNYLEFMIRAMTVNIDQPFVFSSPKPQESTSNGGTNLHYTIPNLAVTLDPNQTYLVGSITVKTPTLSNLGWAADFSFQDSGAPPSKSRIKTSEGCTSLNASPIHSTSTNGGDALCIDPNILFTVVGEGLTCSTSKVNVGLSAMNPPANIRLNKVEFELDFSWAPASGISITGVNFPSSWPALDCATFGCYGSPGQKSCWEVGAGGKKLKFCYQTDDPNAPLFVLGFANIEILLNTPENACIESVKVSKLRINYIGNDNPPPCIPVIDDITGFPLCGSPTTMLTGTVTTEVVAGVSMGVEEVLFTLTGALSGAMDGMADCPNVSCSAPCEKTDLSDDDGFYRFSCMDCPSCNLLKVIPEKNDNPLNGVTTYDLVLISKHILGVEPLNSPYKMIAADANKSGSITTFDIVEFRKLILGIYTNLPSNKSWRFVDKEFMFPNPLNPFQAAFPEGINCIAFPTSGEDFVGVKIGDVNNTVVAHRPLERPMVNLTWPNLRTTAGETITVPVRYSGLEPMEAIQLGLRFDPSKLQLIGPSMGDIESYLPGNFNLLKASEGEIRTLWLPMTDASEKIQPNNVLFYLTFKVLGAMPDSGLPLWLDSQLLDCAAWKPDGVEYAVGLEAAATRRDEPAVAPTGFQAIIRPNPTAGDATITLESLKSEKCRIALFDAFGQRLILHEVSLIEGKQEIRLPEIAQLPAGVYFWKAYTPGFKAEGHLVKQ